MYQSETSPKAWRGLVMGLYQWSITIGILLASIVNNYMATVSIFLSTKACTLQFSPTARLPCTEN
jgi:MFS family permease